MKRIISILFYIVFLSTSSANAYDCSGLRDCHDYVVNSAGEIIKCNGRAYQCVVGGWCSMGVGSPYEPGAGWAWHTAWTDLGACDTSIIPTELTLSHISAVDLNDVVTIDLEATSTVFEANPFMVTVAGEEAAYNGSSSSSSSGGGTFNYIAQYTWQASYVGAHEIVATVHAGLPEEATETGSVFVSGTQLELGIPDMMELGETRYMTIASYSTSPTSEIPSVTIDGQQPDYGGSSSSGGPNGNGVYVFQVGFSWQADSVGTHQVVGTLGDIVETGAIEVTSTGGTIDCTFIPDWNDSSTMVFVGGDLVKYNGKVYRARWWTQGQPPHLNSGQWQVWEYIGDCIPGT